MWQLARTQIGWRLVGVAAIESTENGPGRAVQAALPAARRQIEPMATSAWPWPSLDTAFTPPVGSPSSQRAQAPVPSWR